MKYLMYFTLFRKVILADKFFGKMLFIIRVFCMVNINESVQIL